MQRGLRHPHVPPLRLPSPTGGVPPPALLPPPALVPFEEQRGPGSRRAPFLQPPARAPARRPPPPCVRVGQVPFLHRSMGWHFVVFRWLTWPLTAVGFSNTESAPRSQGEVSGCAILFSCCWVRRPDTESRTSRAAVALVSAAGRLGRASGPCRPRVPKVSPPTLCSGSHCVHSLSSLLEMTGDVQR